MISTVGSTALRDVSHTRAESAIIRFTKKLVP